MRGLYSQPDWVPDSIVEYYDRIFEEGHPLNWEVSTGDIKVLDYCIESPEMEKAWRSVTKLAELSDPREFASAIVITTWSARNIERFPTKSEIEPLSKLLKKVRELINDYQKAIDGVSGKTLNLWVREDPHKLLEKLADELEFLVGTCKISHRRYRERSGKPNSQNSKRTFVIRSLTERMWELYGQPLYKVVAATSGVILDEDVDPESARQLMRSSNHGKISSFEDRVLNADPYFDEFDENA